MKPILLIHGDTRYTFASGRVRSLENRMLNKAGVSKLLDSTLDEFPRILAEFNYIFPSNIETPQQIETYLIDEMKRLFKFIDDLSADKNFPALIRMRYDFLNCAYLLKEIISKNLATLLPWGTIDIAYLRKIFEDERFDKLPEHISDALKFAQKLYNDTNSPASIDSTIEGIYLKHLKSHLPHLQFIHDYYELYFALTNIINFIRSRISGKPLNFFESLFIDSGLLKFDYFKSIYDLPFDQLPPRFLSTDFGRPLADAVQFVLNHKDYTPIQEFKDKVLIDYLSNSKYCPFGLEILFSYYIKKEREIGVIRAIAKAKLFEIPQEIIKKALPYGYA